MTPSQFKNACEGIFYSKLNYCIQVFGHVWNTDRLVQAEQRFPAFTKDDNRRLQVLQNKILRLKSGLDPSTPTRTLLLATGDLSVQQLCCHHTLMTTFRATTTGKPVYLAGEWKLRHPDLDGIFPHRQHYTTTVAHRDLATSRGGTVYRAPWPQNRDKSHV